MVPVQASAIQAANVVEHGKVEEVVNDVRERRHAAQFIFYPGRGKASNECRVYHGLCTDLNRDSVQHSDDLVRNSTLVSTQNIEELW